MFLLDTHYIGTCFQAGCFLAGRWNSILQQCYDFQGTFGFTVISFHRHSSPRGHILFTCFAVRKPKLRKAGWWVQDWKAGLNPRAHSRSWAISTAFLKFKIRSMITGWERVRWEWSYPSWRRPLQKGREGEGKKPASMELLFCAGYFPRTLSFKWHLFLPGDWKETEIKQDSFTSPKSHSLQVAKLGWQPVFRGLLTTLHISLQLTVHLCTWEILKGKWQTKVLWFGKVGVLKDTRIPLFSPPRGGR